MTQDDLQAALDKAIADRDKLLAALIDLTHAATVVDRQGARVGPQWTGLGYALLKADIVINNLEKELKDGST